MCRYAQYGPSKRHFACFGRRKAFKRRPLPDRWPREPRFDANLDPAPCPDCGRPMADMGLDFKPPARAEVEHREVVAHLSRRGDRYGPCGCGGPGYRPSRWAEVPAFLAEHQPPAAGAALAARFRRGRAAGRVG